MDWLYNIVELGIFIVCGNASINERNDYIVQTNRKYCWRQAWVTNVYWFLCNVGLYVISRNMQTPSDTFWNGL